MGTREANKQRYQIPARSVRYTPFARINSPGGRMRRAALVFVLVASVGLSAADDAKGTLNYKGKSKDFAVALKYAHFVKGPDDMDPKATVKRIILSSTD